jgi:hypothetical protein
MPLPTERTIYDVVSAVLATIVIAYLLVALLWTLRRSRRELAIGRSVTMGVGLRLLAMLGVALLAPSFFGGDEVTFLRQARALSEQPLLAHTPLHPESPLHIWMFSLEIRLFDFSEITMRIVQIGIAVAGLVFFAAAVHDLAGSRAATLAAWFLLLEPAGAFFGGLLHKEALMTLATGLAVFGGASFWRRQDVPGLALLILGCVVGVATRPYAGWSLTAAAAVLIIHRGLAPYRGWRRRSLLLTTVVAAAAALAVPVILEGSQSSLETLQASQAANATSGADLELEGVNYSTPADLILNLPRRMFDVLFRPFPWQLANPSQQLGFFGSLTALGTLWLLLTSLVSKGGKVMRRVAPFVYPGLFLLAAYAVTTGNAGTSFRHRAQLVALGLCVVVTLRAQTWIEGWPIRKGNARRARTFGQRVPL